MDRAAPPLRTPAWPRLAWRAAAARARTDWLRWAPVLRRGWLVLLALLLLFAGAALWTTPSTLVVASLRTERVQFRVTSPEAARMAFARAHSDLDNTCADMLYVEPGLGATVSYTRPARAALEVYLEGPLTVTRADGEVARPVRLTLTVADCDDCPPGADRRQRLPVEGSHVSFGAHPLQLSGPHQPSLRLLGGSLTVYGRALSHVLGVPVTPERRRNALYVAGAIPVPGGSVIEDRPADAAAGAPRSAIWSGFADVDFERDGALALVVEAATNASSVTLFLPAPNLGGLARSGDPETVSLSLLARLAGDPHLVLAYGALGLLAALRGLAAWLHVRMLRQQKAQA